MIIQLYRIRALYCTFLSWYAAFTEFSESHGVLIIEQYSADFVELCISLFHSNKRMVICSVITKLEMTAPLSKSSTELVVNSTRMDEHVCGLHISPQQSNSRVVYIFHQRRQMEHIFHWMRVTCEWVIFFIITVMVSELYIPSQQIYAG